MKEIIERTDQPRIVWADSKTPLLMMIYYLIVM